MKRKDKFWLFAFIIGEMLGGCSKYGFLVFAISDMMRHEILVALSSATMAYFAENFQKSCPIYKKDLMEHVKEEIRAARLEKEGLV